MSVASFCRRVLLAWRGLSRQLWGPPPTDRRRHLGNRMARLRERMVTLRRHLERLASQRRDQEARQAELCAFVVAHLDDPEVVAAALRLEELRADVERLKRRQANGEARYRRLRDRFDAVREELRRAVPPQASRRSPR